VLDCPFVDVGHDWLIFALPPAELAVHPVETDDRHELSASISRSTQPPLDRTDGPAADLGRP
jgi:hypothetical protein